MKDFEPHPSHKMSNWESTIVTISVTPRFGKIRKCLNCEAEHAKTGTGQAHHNELAHECLCKDL